MTEVILSIALLTAWMLGAGMFVSGASENLEITSVRDWAFILLLAAVWPLTYSVLMVIWLIRSSR